MRRTVGYEKLSVLNKALFLQANILTENISHETVSLCAAAGDPAAHIVCPETPRKTLALILAEDLDGRPDEFAVWCAEKTIPFIPEDSKDFVLEILELCKNWWSWNWRAFEEAGNWMQRLNTLANENFGNYKSEKIAAAFMSIESTIRTVDGLGRVGSVADAAQYAVWASTWCNLCFYTDLKGEEDHCLFVEFLLEDIL